MTSLLHDDTRPLILASRSPRRRALLRGLGVRFEVRTPDVDETHSGAVSPAKRAMDIATRKALHVAADLGEGLVLGADTIVVLGETVLGKPIDAEEARTMLGRLCGRRHEVVTGLAVIDAATGRREQGFERTLVTMRAASHQEIDCYVETGEPLDKAGAYGAQALGALFIERVEGCFYNVVGLPLVRLRTLLQRFSSPAERPFTPARPM